MSNKQAMERSCDYGCAPELIQRLARCASLPSPPAIAMRIIDLAQDVEADIDDVLQVISGDPAISAKLLRVANSPLHGLRSSADSLRQAATLLGLDSTLTIALGFALVSGVKADPGDEFDYGRFWARSLASASCARLLGSSVGQRKLDRLFLAGLLQDIGILAINRLEPAFYAQSSDQSDHSALSLAETEQLGADHACIGARMLSDWRLPDWLCDAVRHSHEPSASADATRPFNAVVALGALLADQGWADRANGDAKRLQSLALDWLDLDEDAWLAICNSATETVRETARMFNFRTPEWDYAELLREQAQEVLVVRTLRAQADLAQFRQDAEGLQRKAEDLEQQSRHDGLTGLYNRAYLDELLVEEFGKARRQKTPLSVLFVDIDHFKRINDTLGHDAGDEVLRAAAQVLRDATRRGDQVARYGGEEFICILPLTGPIGARELSLRLLDGFRRLTVTARSGAKIRITVSIGQATTSPEWPMSDVHRLIKAADQALYQAKNGGRNQSREAGRQMSA